MQRFEDSTNDNWPTTQEGSTKGERRVHKLVYVALFIIAACIGLLTLWSFQPENILEIRNSPFPTRTLTGEPNTSQVVVMSADYCKTYEIEGRLRMSFKSKTREIFLPETSEDTAKGCVQTEIAVFLPKDLPPDRYRVHFSATYNLNPLKKNVTQEFDSAEFDVSSDGRIDNVGERPEEKRDEE
jgi:hypothetical protein